MEADPVPAAPHQHRGQPDSLGTAADGNITHAEAYRLDVVEEHVVVVAVGVPPLMFRRMTGLSVELDTQQVPVIEVVQIPDSRREVAPRLPARAGQAMSAFDIAYIAAFQREHDALGDVIERVGEPPAPAHSFAGGKGLPYHLRARELPPGGTGQPAVGIVEGLRGVH